MKNLSNIEIIAKTTYFAVALMTKIKKYYCILVCTIMCCFCQTIFCEVPNMLEVYPGKSSVTINLPCQYKHFTPQEIAQTELLMERCYTILRPDSQKRFVLMGNLKPCIGIGLYSKTKSVAVLGHIHYTSNIDDFIAKAQEAFGPEIDPAEITGFLYTCRTANYNDVQATSLGTWKACYQGRTQEQEVTVLKDIITKAFKITHPEQINTTIRELNNYTDAQLGWYPFAELSIVVYLSERGMEINNTCIFHEEMILKGFRAEFDRCYSEYVLHGGKSMITSQLLRFSQIIFNDIFEDVPIKNRTIYGAVEFRNCDPNISSDIFLRQEQIDHVQFSKMLTRSCEGHACAYCFKTLSNLQNCAVCKKTYYCSRACQGAHWKLSHKERCQKIKQSL